mmetsp:Transcript_66250/g.138074  ORF Transcript_66250/g.138074 Transcript_66250/m.138074 type:complete len:96 (+) Transcript_66250:147-434(+)
MIGARPTPRHLMCRPSSGDTKLCTMRSAGKAKEKQTKRLNLNKGRKMHAVPTDVATSCCGALKMQRWWTEFCVDTSTGETRILDGCLLAHLFYPQ